MHVSVGDVRLFVDIEGAGLAPEGPIMRERPTLVLLHGGPGFDHSNLKRSHGALADVAQLVYLDHRGNGRSERSVPERWNLAQWADDLHALMQALGIVRPIVLGVSFGGFVAQAYALRHPEGPAKLILSSTAGHMRIDRALAAFERRGGSAARAIAERFWCDAENPAVFDPYFKACMPLYNTTPQDPDGMKRAVMNLAVLSHFFKPGGEGYRFDFLPELHRIRCPVLVDYGEDDPITPPACSEDLLRVLPKRLATEARFVGCGHGVLRDDPLGGAQVIRDFILR
ncbi:MAG: alpha/beta hydrolase [Alphaproteobacteria bacterium]|nr:alpha/beta hydrolase [Alphaproteobacteria bacterium]